MYYSDFNIMQGDNEGDPDAMTGEELWSSLQDSRQKLEVSYLLLLSQAQNQAIACSEVEEYTRLRNTQLELERQALREMSKAGVNIGILEPSALPSIEQCMSGETSIWLAPQTSKETLQGAAARYREIQRYQRSMFSMAAPPRDTLGVVPLAVIVVAGVVLVAAAAATAAAFVFYLPGRTVVNGHKSMVESYLKLRKQGLTHEQALQVFNAVGSVLPQIGPKLPWGITGWQGVFLGVALGVGAAVGGYFLLTRTETGKKLGRKLRLAA